GDGFGRQMRNELRRELADHRQDLCFHRQRESPCEFPGIVELKCLRLGDARHRSQKVEYRSANRARLLAGNANLVFQPNGAEDPAWAFRAASLCQALFKGGAKPENAAFPRAGILAVIAQDSGSNIFADDDEARSPFALP